MPHDPVFAKQVKETRKRLRGQPFLHSVIVRVGTPLDARLNYPTLIPVKLLNGQYAIILQEDRRSGRHLPLISNHRRIESAIKNGRMMPLVMPGADQNEVLLKLYPPMYRAAHAIGTVYCNEKLGQGDTYREVSRQELNRLARERRKERKQAESEE